MIDDRLFAFVFYMMAHTGKRLSDVAMITESQLQQLRQRGVCVLKIPKTGKLGRIELPELLHSNELVNNNNDGCGSGSQDACCCGNVDECGGGGAQRRSAINAATRAAERVRETMEIFLLWVRKDRTLTIPFKVTCVRRGLDSRLRDLYTRATGVTEKPKSLGFHALRRIYAVYRYLNGVSVDRLSEYLDHSSREQTNCYINTCLYEITN